MGIGENSGEFVGENIGSHGAILQAASLAQVNPWADNTPALNATGTGTRYDVGGGNNNYPDLVNVPWHSLVAGDVVNIWPGTYATISNIRAVGTEANPVIINGVCVNGVAPHITCENAVNSADILADNFGTYLNFGVQGTGCFTLYRISTDVYNHHPQHIIFQNLKMGQHSPAYSYTNHLGNVVEVPGVAAVNPGNQSAALYITIQNCEIYDGANGVFCNSLGWTYTNDGTMDDYSVSKGWKILNNKIYGNGGTGGRVDREHNLYMQCEDALIEGNWIGPQRIGSVGSALKDRGSGTIIRYNVIYGSARILDLVGSEGAFGYFATTDLTKYDNMHVYGNILINDYDIANAGIGGSGSGTPIHWGDDNGFYDNALARPTAHMGTLYFYHNTFIINSDYGVNGGTYRMRVFDSEYPNTIEARNNIFYIIGTMPEFYWLSGDSVTSSVQSAVSSRIAGTPTVLNFEGSNVIYMPSTTVTGSAYTNPAYGTVNNNDVRYVTDPALVNPLVSPTTMADLFNSDFTTSGSGPADGNAVSLPLSLQTNYPVSKQYANDYSTETRVTNNDIGALET